MQTRPNPPEILFRTEEVAKLADVTYRQLDYWSRKNLLPASVRESSGSGSQRLYSADDVIKARILGQLSRMGFQPGRMTRPAPADPVELVDWLRTELETLETLTRPQLLMV